MMLLMMIVPVVALCLLAMWKSRNRRNSIDFRGKYFVSLDPRLGTLVPYPNVDDRAIKAAIKSGLSSVAVLGGSFTISLTCSQDTDGDAVIGLLSGSHCGRSFVVEDRKLTWVQRNKSGHSRRVFLARSLSDEQEKPDVQYEWVRVDPHTKLLVTINAADAKMIEDGVAQTTALSVTTNSVGTVDLKSLVATTRLNGEEVCSPVRRIPPMSASPPKRRFVLCRTCRQQMKFLVDLRHYSCSNTACREPFRSLTSEALTRTGTFKLEAVCDRRRLGEKPDDKLLVAVSATLDDFQLRVLTHAIEHSSYLSKSFYSSSCSDSNIRQRLKRFSSCFRSAPIIIHVPLEDPVKLEMILRDTHFRSQFETFSSRGYLADPKRKYVGRSDWEKIAFAGLYDGSEPFRRPKYGLLNYSWNPTGDPRASQYGKSYLILRRDVRLRSTVAMRDTSLIKSREEVGTLDHCYHLYSHLLHEDCSKIGKVFQPTSANHVGYYKEVQIHGEVSLRRDVFAVVVDETFERNEHSLASLRSFCTNHRIKLLFQPRSTDLRGATDQRTNAIHRAFREVAPKRPIRCSLVALHLSAIWLLLRGAKLLIFFAILRMMLFSSCALLVFMTFVLPQMLLAAIVGLIGREYADGLLRVTFWWFFFGPWIAMQRKEMSKLRFASCCGPLAVVIVSLQYLCAVWGLSFRSEAFLHFSLSVLLRTAPAKALWVHMYCPGSTRISRQRNRCAALCTKLHRLWSLALRDRAEETEFGLLE